MRKLDDNYIENFFGNNSLTLNDFSSLAEVEDRIFSFQDRHQEVAKLFEWKFTRADLNRLYEKLTIDERIDYRKLVTACC